MSIVLCETCDRLIDSDEDPDCFVEIGNMRRLVYTEVMCASCRERLLEEDDRRDYAEHAKDSADR